MPTTKPLPYKTNLEYLDDALGYLWNLGKSRRPVRRSRRGSHYDEEAHDADKSLVHQRLAAEKLVELNARTAITRAVGDVRLSLEDLADRHNLSEFEKHVLLIVLAPSIDPQFGGLYEEISNCRRPEVGAILQILCGDLQSKVESRHHFTNTGTLLANGLLNLSYSSHVESEADFMQMELELPRHVSSHILGAYDIDDQLIAFSSVIDPTADFDSVILPEKDKKAVLELVGKHSEYCETRAAWGFDRVLSYGKGVVMLFSGPPGVGKTLLAHALANKTGHRLMLVDVRKLAEYSRNSFEENLQRVFHEARLQNAMILFDEADELFSDRSFNGAMPTILREFERLDGVCILATNRRSVLDEALERRILYKLDFEIPTAERREDIWRIHLPEEAPVADDIDIKELAEEFEFSGGFIKNAVLVAVNRALSRDGENRLIRHEDLRYGATTQRQNRLQRHADKVVPKVTLDDVVVDADTRRQLDGLVAAARSSAKVFRNWGFGEKWRTGRGLAAVMSGKSGVGKTLSAEAVAGSLGRNLYPVSLASVISKYVGDTEKHLLQVFETARESESVIFFDEADSLFASRLEDGSHHAHYINQQINCLLAAIEQFDGIVILATNRPEAFDQAFERRIRYHIRFSEPDQATREALWRKLLPEDAPLAEDVDVVELAERFAVTGGQIRQVVLRAAFAAAEAGSSITQGLLLRCAEDEVPYRKDTQKVGFHAA